MGIFGQEKRMGVVERRGRRRPGAEGGPHPGRVDQGVTGIFLTDLKHLTLMFTDFISVDDLNSWPRRYQR